METVTKSDVREILTQLALMRRDIEYMKSMIKDDDCFFSEEDKEAVNEYEKEKKEGKLISSDQLKKSLNYA